jgi:ABC-2 type transport system ATP-binding protein
MDEAERCHRLAILDRGVKVADGTPQELQASTGMKIVEVIAEDPYAAQVAISDLDEVVSVTQLGVRLRVLIPDSFRKPRELIERTLAASNLRASATLTSATLEDVFVAVTLKPKGPSK